MRWLKWLRESATSLFAKIHGSENSARYQESELSRRLLQIARDPNVTANELEAVADEAMAYLDARWYPTNGCVLVLEAVAAHPATPPACFNRLFLRTPVARRAFCRNPVAPFLLLENPDFVASLHEHSQRELLCEADLPSAYVQLLAADGGPARAADIQETARLHVAFAGEARTQTEWEMQARNLYRKIAREATESVVRERLAELVELGLLPPWADGGRPFAEPLAYFSQTFGSGRPAAEVRDPSELEKLSVDEWATLPNAPTHRLMSVLKYAAPNACRLALRHPNAPPNAREIGGDAFAEAWGSGISALFEKYDRDVATRQQALLTLTSALHRRLDRQDISNRIASQFWTERFEAVWLAPLGEVALSGCAPDCTGLDLLDHLSRDANRIVRAAAKTRLADSNYRLSLGG